LSLPPGAGDSAATMDAGTTDSGAKPLLAVFLFAGILLVPPDKFFAAGMFNSFDAVELSAFRGFDTGSPEEDTLLLSVLVPSDKPDCFSEAAFFLSFVFRFSAEERLSTWIAFSSDS